MKSLIIGLVAGGILFFIIKDNDSIAIAEKAFVITLTITFIYTIAKDIFGRQEE